MLEVVGNVVWGEGEGEGEGMIGMIRQRLGQRKAGVLRGEICGLGSQLPPTWCKFQAFGPGGQHSIFQFGVGLAPWLLKVE